MDDHDLHSGSSDYMVDEHSSMEGQDEYEYPDESPSDGGHEASSDRDQDVFIDYDAADHEDEDGESERRRYHFRNPENDGEDEGDSNSRFGARSFTMQDILGNLVQDMEGRPQASGERSSSGNFSRGSGPMNLADVFPEILSLLNDGTQRGSSGFGGGSRNHRISKLVRNVQNADEDPYFAMESLRELSEHLLMMNQVVIDRVFPVEKLLRGILNILSNPILKGELELQLVSCRCLYNLFEVSPESISMAVDENVVPILQEILQDINYIDLAEQILETLELVSRLHGREVLQSGALVSCLQYLDFFTIHAQRKAVSIVANSCTKVRMDSFETIQTLFVLLKPIFSNASDRPIVSKLLNALYGVCGGLRDSKMLESLFTFEVVEHLLKLSSAVDSQLEDRLKCLDILSVLVNFSSEISRELLESCDLIGTLEECFACYSKSSSASLHETLMFVPKPLLHAIARTLALLLPTEQEQLLSVDAPKQVVLENDNERVNKTLTNLTPLLIEIFINTVDFDVRRCVLVALARVVSFLRSPLVGGIDKSITHLVGTTLAQNESTLDQGRNQAVISGGLIIGVLSLLDILTARFASHFLPGIRREGIVDLVNKLYEFLEQRVGDGKFSYDENGTVVENAGAISSDTVGSLSDNEEILEDEEDEEYDIQFGAIDIPEQVKPKKIKFEVLRPLSYNYIRIKTYELSKNLSELFSENQGTVIEELKEIESLVKDLNVLDAHKFTGQDWCDLWNRVKNSIFNDHFEISSFELISSGLVSVLSKLVEQYGFSSFDPKRTFTQVFGEQLPIFVNILQSALTRLESFRIVECGLQGGEGRVASLGKQMKIKLVYDGDAQADNIAPHLTTITLSIHCIASLKTLGEFLRHRAGQTRFLNSLLPGLSRSSGVGPDDMEDLKNWQFEFLINNNLLNPSDTIFGAVFKSIKQSNRDASDIWRDAQVINFRRVKEPSSGQDLGLANIYAQRSFSKNEALRPAEDILNLLKFTKVNTVPNDLFVNSKLSAKIARQLEEPLVVAGGVLPDWSLYLTKNYPFLFPFETRIFFLQCTSFGYGRLIQIWRNRMGNAKETNADDPLQQLGRVTRHKLRLSRDTLFLSGLKVLNKYGSSPSVLEIEYQDEVGTGLGPTLEFYASMSREFSKKSLGMWRYEALGSSITQESEYVNTLLFPAPLTSSQDNSKVLELFHHLGTFVARSMLDNRILDLNFSKVFFELTHRISDKASVKAKDTQDMLHLLSLVDPQLERSLRALYSESDLESLTLTFTLPGYDIELVENGRSILVNSRNLSDYVERVLDYVLGTGIDQQLNSFIEGFSKVFPYTSLLLLTPEEIVQMCGRIKEDWSSETLYGSLIADHGYTMDSPTIHDLICVMSTFNDQERRLFLQFLTGSPKLPIGGFKSLSPRLTVVLKHPEEGMNSDAYLPSVMTCANYFKLPKYTNQQIMRSRITQAMQEGSGAFLLS